MNTGYETLDKIWGQLEEGKLIIVAARPAIGKTTLLITIGQRIALNNKVLFISFEYSKSQIEKRFGLSNITIEKKKQNSINEINSLVLNNSYKLILIDYLQLFTEDYENTTNELKKLAIEKKVCIIVASQLTRKIDLRPASKQRPVLQDLEDTINTSAQNDMIDKVVFLYRDKNFFNSTDKTLEVITYNKSKEIPETTELHFSDDYAKLYD